MAPQQEEEEGGRRHGPRSRAPAPSGRAAVLAKLKSLREGGGSRIDEFELKMEGRIYDSLDEEEYAKLAAERRKAARDFVVDDDGLGYVDSEDEGDDWDADARHSSSEGEEEGKKKTKKNSKSDPKSADGRKEASGNRKAAAFSAAASLLGKQRLSSMFSAASGAGFHRKTKEERAAAMGKVGTAPDNILEDILADITADDVDRERKMRRNRAERATGMDISEEVPVRVVVRNVFPQPHQEQKAAASLIGSSSEPVSDKMNSDIPQNAPQDSPEDIPQDLPTEALPEANPCEPPQIQALEPESSPVKNIAPQKNDKSTDAEMNETVKTEIAEREHKFNAIITKPANGLGNASTEWQALCQGGSGENVKPEEAHEDEAANALPLDAEGKLPFYLIDAYEEAFGANSGTVFLFGKVKTGSKYSSCCVIVRNMARCLYAIPSPTVFPRIDITELELEASSGDSNKVFALKRKLQEMATPLKKEVGKMLMDMDVSSFSMVPVKRSYSFGRDDLPKGENYYLKLTYAFKDAPLPADAKGVHFTALLGTHTSALELFLIKRKIKGPGWLLISNPLSISSSEQMSWCKLEVVVDSSKLINVASPGKAPDDVPPIVAAAINLKTVINHKQNINEIVSASVVYCHKVKIDMPMPQAEWNSREMLGHFSIVRKLDGGIFPVGFTSEVASINKKAGSNVLSLESSERALLNRLLIKLHQLDPDVLVGHNISGFDLDILLHRVQVCKVQSGIWSKIGRLKRATMPKLGGGGNTFGAGAGLGALVCIAGRLLCDTYISSRDLLKEVSYTLTQLSRSQLGRERKEVVSSEIPAMFQQSSSLLELVECGETDAWLAMGLMFHLSILPLTRQLTNISGNLWSKSLQGARAQRVEYLLLHEFHSRKYLVPDKLSARQKELITQKRKLVKAEANDEAEVINEGDVDAPVTAGNRKKGPAYMGGLVLEPKKGLYDKYILLLDFNSLYPSIIQEYNICFTTVHQPSDGAIPSLPSTELPGVLPQVLKSLVERRRQVKQWLKRTSEPLKRQQLDIQQQALKLTANSMYGCLGFTNSRFYAKAIAELVTYMGREILQSTVDLVQHNMNLEVIYGDTDSIMIYTGLDDLIEARKIAVKVIKEVNKMYKLLEIDLDGVFKRMLLLKKKKYAAVKVEANGDGTFREVIEQKGLDIVRRDWSLLAKETGNYCLEQILSGGSCEDVVESIHNRLRKLQEDTRNGLIELEKYVITKSLTKPPEDYPDAKNQPHVQVALRLKQSGNRIGCAAGDTVPYIICCQQGAQNSTGIAERARHPDELKQDSGNWMVDVDYYLSQQIHPVVSRLCATIEGTDAGRLADCLGLDSSKFHHKVSSAGAERDEALLLPTTVDDDDRYKDCESLQLLCPNCSSRFPFPGVGNIVGSLNGGAATEPAQQSGTESLPEDCLQCQFCREKGIVQRISSAMLSNQVKQRAEEYVSRYYDGWMRCDDELCGLATRNVNLRVLGDADRGTVCPNYPRCTGHLVRQYTEADLYKQLTYFSRLLDIDHALQKVSDINSKTLAEKKLLALREALDMAMQTIKNLRDRSKYTWVQINLLCV